MIRRYWKDLLVVFLVLAIAGLATYPLERRVWNELEAGQPTLQLEDVTEALGQGMLIGMFGGFRTILGDFLWIQGNYHWEAYDLPATMAFINLTTSVDPRTTFFWLNGARVIGYDMPVWRIREMGDFGNVPQAVVDRVQKEQGLRAIELLDRALQFHPDNHELLLEKGIFYREKVKDIEMSAKYYGLVAEQPNAPAYAARIYAETLRQLGRNEEAYQYYRRLYPHLTGNPYYRRDVVLERIRELEEELRIPFHERYRTPSEQENLRSGETQSHGYQHAG